MGFVNKAPQGNALHRDSSFAPYCIMKKQRESSMQALKILSFCNNFVMRMVYTGKQQE